MTTDPNRPESTEPEASATAPEAATPAVEPEAPAAEAQPVAPAAPEATAVAASDAPAPETPAAEPAPVAAPVAAAVSEAAPVAAAPALPPATPPAAPPPTAWQAPPEPTGPFPGVKFADHGKRLVSYILDVIIVALLTTAVALVFVVLIAVFMAMDLGFLAVLSGISLFLSIFVVSLVYWPYFWIKSGTTPGMRAVGGLRVVMDKDGGPVTLGPAILRLIGYWIDGLIFYLGFIWILIDSRRRGWHDLIAGTVVVQDE